MVRRLVGFGIAMTLAVTMLGTASASAAGATLNVVHAIPGVDVEVCVNGEVAIPGFNPGEVVTGVGLPAGGYDIAIVPEGEACEASAILQAADVELAGGRNYTAIAHLTEDGTPTLGLFRNNVRPLAQGSTRMTIRHTAAAPAVDVWANGRTVLEDVTNGATATLKVPAGVYAAWVSLPDEYAPVIGPAVLKLARGTAYQVYAWGSAASGYEFAVVSVRVGTK
jgi:uncharacterized protein DUF4397